MSNIPLSFHGYQLHPTLLGEPLPQALSFETTNHCNLKCTHCGHSEYPEFEKGFLDETLFDKVSHLLGKGGIPTANLSDFGEPFMSKKWWRLFDKAKQIEGLSISFITNGLLLHHHFDKLTHPGLNISISVDGASEATYGHFRGEGHFSTLVDNLRAWHSREKSGALPRSSRSFITVLSAKNVHEMTAIVELAAELGVTLVAFSFQVFYDRKRLAEESLYSRKTLYDRNLQAAAARARELGVQILHPAPFDPSVVVPTDPLPNLWLWRDAQGKTRCGAISSNCYIKFHGQIEACCVPDRHPLGDLNTDNFLDIWHGPKYRKLRRSFATGQWLPSCENCNVMQSVDVTLEQSHYIPLTRDDGRLIPMPQPYRITTLEKQYREWLTALRLGAKTPTELMPALREMLVTDEGLHEVANLLGVLWLASGHHEKGINTLRHALRQAPDDVLIQQNLHQAEVAAASVAVVD